MKALQVAVDGVVTQLPPGSQARSDRPPVDLIGQWSDEAFELGARPTAAAHDPERFDFILNADAAMGTGSAVDERLAPGEAGLPPPHPFGGGAT
jgi:hypothetical protein